jgi:hypothetical protein
MAIVKVLIVHNVERLAAVWVFEKLLLGLSPAGD